MNLGQKGGLPLVETEYSIAQLISYLKANKEKHIKEYAIAKEQYDIETKKLREKFKKFAKKVPKDLNDDKSFDAYVNSLTVINVDMRNRQAPVNAENMYDSYIRNFETIDPSISSIKLTLEQANALINDAWDWAQNAKTTNGHYLSIAASQ